MQDISISRNKSKSLKFIASIFIILTHIFPKVDIVNSLRYTSLFYYEDYPIE